VKSVWYCKHTDIAFLTTSPSQFLFQDGRADREEAMLWRYDTDPSSTCHPDDRSPHWPVVWPIGLSSFSATAVESNYCIMC